MWLSQIRWSLEELCIERDVIGRESAQELERVLISSILVKLILEDCQMDLYSALRIANGLSKTSSCTSLVVRRCSLDDQMLQVLSGGLANNRVIKEVSLEGNNISDPTSLATRLPTMTSLRYLSLNHNLLTDKGGRLLLKGLQDCPSLVRLKIQVQRTYSRQILPQTFHNIYFYSRWNSIQGWTLWTAASNSLWSHVLAKLNENGWKDIMYHLLHKHPEILMVKSNEGKTDSSRVQPNKRIKL
jgi:hypothetical protein